MWSGALESSGVLLLYPIISLASPMTIILITTLNLVNIHIYPYAYPYAYAVNDADRYEQKTVRDRLQLAEGGISEAQEKMAIVRDYRGLVCLYF